MKQYDQTLANCQNTRGTVRSMTKRDFLSTAAMGIGGLGLASLMEPEDLMAAGGTGKAKRVIHIFLQGAPSHIDTFDPKPALEALDGKKLDRGVANGSPFKFNKSGKSGLEISEIFPNLQQHADDICVVRSMVTDVPDHNIATVFMNTGNLKFVRPSLGAWVTYGLGAENENLPAFVSLRPGGNPRPQSYQSAFLPGLNQGTPINTQLKTVSQMISNIKGYESLKSQRGMLDFLKRQNTLHSLQNNKDSHLESRIKSFELAYNMQIEATDAFDISKESKATLAKYGNTAQGKQLLIARRLAERDVRFVQAWHGSWDHHDQLYTAIKGRAKDIDQPLAALISDLKERGMLDETLIIVGGEFGRTARRDGSGRNGYFGRSHSHTGFSTLMIGGGVKGGIAHGATDELGINAVTDKMNIHDLHATVLHTLGFDHKKLTYTYNGRPFRLTDVFGQVHKNIIA
jgi:hypothetical protein|tara:strand:- start:5635 stop:7008 length:1374 start_codon:yes stop_codon:yes gene_type:complete